MPATRRQLVRPRLGRRFPGDPLEDRHARGSLTMVESRSRKAAFLREVVRSLALDEVGTVLRRDDSRIWPPSAPGARGLHHRRGPCDADRSLCCRADHGSLLATVLRSSCSRQSTSTSEIARLRADQFAVGCCRATLIQSSSADCSTWNKLVDPPPDSRRILLQQLHRYASQYRSFATTNGPHHRRRQPEGRRRQDHDRHQPGRLAGARRSARPARRRRSAGQSHQRRRPEGASAGSGGTIYNALTTRGADRRTPRPSSSARRSIDCR